MLSVVTGGSGFLGANLVRALLERGDRVRVADVRKTEALDGLDVEFVEVDVREPSSLEGVFEDADAVFHLAAVISIVGDPTGDVHRINVEGPRHVASAALRAGVKRFVHCSSVHAFDIEACGPELTEEAPRTTEDNAPAYDKSKNDGETEIRKAIGRGLDAVIVNPTGIIGPHDYGPSRIGELLVQFRNQSRHVNLRGGFDFVDARDVAEGMLAAERKGRTGENYLLSGQRISMVELAELAEQVTGVEGPRVSIPLSIITGLAPLIEKLTPAGEEPLITAESAHALKYSPTVCHHKATEELGYNPRPLIDTVRDTYAWLDRHVAAEAERSDRR